MPRCSNCGAILTRTKSAVCPVCHKPPTPQTDADSTSHDDDALYLRSLGVTLCFIGMGSLFLPLLGFQFVLMGWVNGLQPFGGLAVTTLGGCLYFTRYSRSARSMIIASLKTAGIVVIVLTVLAIIAINVMIAFDI